MNRIVTLHLALLLLLGGLRTPVIAQDETYDWSGDTNSDWEISANWVDEGTGLPPVSPPFPDLGTRVEIAVDSGNTPVIAAGQVLTAYEVRIGRSEGAGLLTMNGGSLTIGNAGDGNRFRVGSGGNGTFNMNGGTLTLDNESFVTGSSTNGQVTITGGMIDIQGGSADLNMDEGAAGAASNLTMSNGSVAIGDVFLVDENATVDMSGGSIVSVDDLRIRRNAVVTVTGGLLETGDDLAMGDEDDGVDGGTLFVNGGIVRANEAGDFVAPFLLEVNGEGLLQFLNRAESVSDIRELVRDGIISTSENMPLGVSVVDVDGVDFTQVSVVPEPSCVVSICLVAMILFSFRRKCAS